MSPPTTPTPPSRTSTTTTMLESPTSPSRPPPPKHRKSLLQKLNQKHEALISHMRAKRTAKETDPKDEPKTPSRSWKLSRRDSTMAPSIKSITRSEMEELEGGSRDYPIEETTPLSASSPREEEETEQDFWFPGASVDSTLQRYESPSSLQPSSLRSRPVSTVVDVEATILSGMEEGAEDAVAVQLERTLTVDSGKTKVDSKFGGEAASRLGYDDEDDEAQLYKHQERDDAKTVGTLSGNSEETAAAKSDVVDLFAEGWDIEFEPAIEEKKGSRTMSGVETVPPETVDIHAVIIEDKNPRLLSLPDEILLRLSLQLDTTSAQLLGLSCKKLHSLLPKSPSPPPPAPTTKPKTPKVKTPKVKTPKVKAPSPQPTPLTPLPSLKYCAECAHYHTWTQSDFYLDALQTLRCRRYLYSNPQLMSDILGTDNFLCESCNSVRPDQKCKTCLKCEECADLRRSWVILSWVEDECDACVASHPPQWQHWKDEFEGRTNSGAHREWIGM